MAWPWRHGNMVARYEQTKTRKGNIRITFTCKTLTTAEVEYVAWTITVCLQLTIVSTARHLSIFWQRVSIACYAERCISYSKSVRLSVCLSVTHWHWVKTTQATIMGSSRQDSPMTLVSSRLTSWQNSKGNIGSEDAEWERGRKNRQFLANKSPYLRNGAR